MAELVTFKPRRPCPLCKKPSHVKYHPFCSDRCAQLDLGKWLSGTYAIPAVETDDMTGSDEPTES
jgi:uncharacterized protein